MKSRFGTLLLLLALSVGTATDASAAIAADCLEVETDGSVFGGARISKIDTYVGSRYIDFENRAVQVTHMLSGDGRTMTAGVTVTSNCGLLTPRLDFDTPAGYSITNIVVARHDYNETTKQLNYYVNFRVNADALLADKVRGLLSIVVNFDFDDRTAHFASPLRSYLETDNAPPAPLRADEFEIVDYGGSPVFSLKNWSMFKRNRDDGSFMEFIGGSSRLTGLHVKLWWMCNGAYETAGSCYKVYNGTYELTVIDEVGNRSAPASFNLLGGGTGGKGKRK